MAWVNALIQGVLVGGLYALFACGLSLMFGVMKVVNLAHGDLAVVAGYVAIGVITVTHIPVLWSFLIVVPLMAVLGYVLQRTILQGALDRSVLTTLMVTFGLSVVIENGLLQLTASGDGTGLAPVTALHGRSQIRSGPHPWSLRGRRGGAPGCSTSSRVRYGRLVRAVADDKETAQLAGPTTGVPASRRIAFGKWRWPDAYGMYSQLAPTTGTDTILLFAFAAVVIGGLGSLWGTLLGGVVLGVAQQIGAQISLSDEVLAGFIVFLAVLVLRPQGLISRGAPS